MGEKITFDIPRASIVSCEDDGKFGIQIDASELVASIHEIGECQDGLLRAVVERIPASEFLDALTDNDAAKIEAIHGDDKFVRPLTQRGTVYLNVLTAYACALGDIPDDYETRAMRNVSRDLDALHEMLCDGRISDARDLLRQMFPDHHFVSDAALTGIAASRNAGQQPNLFTGAAGAFDRTPRDSAEQA